jgi:eukaryotic-like serine/threonine-protein kinase
LPADLTGQSLAHYRITAKLGEGGMGEVYRATDTKLRRDVAIKVLPEAFTQDSERLARFEREAQLLAQLQHPNIASIYGIEEGEGTKALVIELVEGPTLAERLEQGSLPLHESLLVARQIAEALEEAHEKGIIHRDLKPQNIKASIEGKVKVLDFGLAKAMDPTGAAPGSGSASQIAHSPTLTMGATLQGMILGTAAYMAPEQARGGNVDRRADVWAFGVVLYEMLAGETLFAADTVPDTLARVLTREIDLSKLPEAVPAAIRQLLRRCLARSTKDRLHSIADARIVLDDVLAGRIEESAAATATTAEPAPIVRSRGSRLLPWLGGALAGILIGGFAISRWAPGPAASSVGEARMTTLVAGGVSDSPSLSPDGKTLAFTSTRNGETRVWIKDLVSGSESALCRSPSSAPVFSPDGTSVLFGRNEGLRNDLYRVALATREERPVARAAVSGAWAPDGRSVIYRRQPREAGSEQSEDEIVTVDLGSGQERTLFRGSIVSSGGVSPLWSPDGRVIALGVQEGQTGVPDRIALLDPKSGQLEQFPVETPHVTVSKLAGMAWVSSKRLALLLGDGGGVTGSSGSSGRIATFDLDSKQVRSLMPLQPIGNGIAVAGAGSLVVSLGSAEQSLYELRRGAKGGWGSAEPRTEGPYSDRQPAYSPDGKWLLFSSNRSGNNDLWRLNRESGELQRLTDNEAQDWDPAPSPDGRYLLFSSNRSGRYQIWMAEADGSSPRQVTDLENAQNPTMTADGDWIVFTRQGAAADEIGIWKIRPDGRDLTLIRKTSNAFIPETSPDGRFAAYNGSNSLNGARIVRIADGETVPMSAGGGARFRWSVEGGKTFLWAIVSTPNDTTIRRFAFDPVRGVVGEGEIVVGPELATAAESLGVAPDGSALTYSRIASVKTQIIRIDGLDELDRN